MGLVVYTCCILLCYFATSNSFAPHLRTCRWCFNVNMRCFRWCFAQNILGASDETTKHEQMEIACFSSKPCNHFQRSHTKIYKDRQSDLQLPKEAKHSQPFSLSPVAERLPKTKARPENTRVVESQPAAGPFCPFFRNGSIQITRDGLSWHDLVEVQKEQREAERVQEEHHGTLQQAVVVIVNVGLKPW